MDIETTVAGLKLEHPLMNAAGTCKAVAEVRKFARSSVAAVVVGSYSVERREVNPGNVYYSDPRGRFSLNSIGLPNKGYDYLRRYLGQMVELAHGHCKPLVLSIVGFAADEYGKLARLAARCGVDMIEVNLSCPNVRDKLPACYSRESAALIGNAVGSAAAGKLPVSYKLGPQPDVRALIEMVHLLLAKGADAFTVTNTFGDGMVLAASGLPVISTMRAGGIGGPALFPIGLRMVDQLAQIVPPHVGIIGVGGVDSGDAVKQYLAVGARAVQAATVCWNHNGNPGVFGDMLADYVDRLESEEL